MGALLPAIDLAAIATLLFLFALVYTFRTVIDATVIKVLRVIPIVGGRAADAVDGALRDVENTLRHWLDSLIHVGVDFLQGLADSSAELYQELANYAVHVKNSLEYLVQERLFDPITGAITVLRKSVAHLNDRLFNAVSGVIPRLDARIDTLTDRLFNTAIGAIPRISNRIDRLSDHLLDSATGLIPRITARIDRINDRLFDRDTGWIPRLDTRIDSLSGRLFNDVTGAIPRIRSDIGSLRQTLSGLDSWVTPVAAAFGAVALIDILRHVVRCRPKTERLCTLEIGDFEELIGLALIMVSGGEIVAFVRAASHATGELITEMQPALRD